ncbi:hypothetical protein [Dickeya undicola]|uniref:Uncharacterized protein n=1 Tax=Dickeya undicola TaxID=1577887 RepID=A0A3N0G7Q0_9GAMM|nr:hypothetical protein [Dickeya undicola]RNM08138.1 hypothetical protein EF878_04980 [Dickeya undicola]RNM20967.1 hypothetical protein EFS38_17015 [Dickeya undicola]
MKQLVLFCYPHLDFMKRRFVFLFCSVFERSWGKTAVSAFGITQILLGWVNFDDGFFSARIGSETYFSLKNM